MRAPHALAAAGALIACVFALSTASAAKKPAATPAPAHSGAGLDSDAVLVRVGKDVITARTLNDRLMEIPEQYRATYQTPDGRQQLLDRLIEERVWLLDAEGHGVPARPEVQRQLVSQRRDVVIRAYVNEIIATNPAPTDSDAHAYYDTHQGDFRTPATVAMSHIQLKTELEAKRVLALARAKGADWKKLVTQYSADTLTRTTGGSLGTATRDGNFASLGPQPALAETALTLADGTIAGPFKTTKGWHVIKVETVHPESVRDFEQVRTFIVRTLTQQRQGSFYQGELQKAKSRIGVTPDSTTIRRFLSSRKTAREMFQDAQQASAPTDRIDRYRKVVQEYPDADVTPQAQFMVGFVYSEELKNYDEAEKAFRELLARWPKSELSASAQWMVEHMRTEEAPSFPGADSLAAAPAARKGAK